MLFKDRFHFSLDYVLLLRVYSFYIAIFDVVVAVLCIVLIAFLYYFVCLLPKWRIKIYIYISGTNGTDSRHKDRSVLAAS